MDINSIQKFLIEKIKSKKELSSLDDDYVEKILQKFLKNKKIAFEKYSTIKQFEKSNTCKEIISQTRSQLRELYGVYIKQNLFIYEDKIKQINSYDAELIEVILKSHQSSNERINNYSETYNLIFQKLFEIGLAKKFTLIDLACGVNPFSYKYFPEKPTYYFASDLSKQDMDLINIFFKNAKINGIAKAYDLLDEQNILEINKKEYDLCFLFKALDSFEKIKRHFSKKLISELNAKYFVVSFAKVTIGGKKTIGENKRFWFENFLTKEDIRFEKIDLINEIYYVFKK